MKKIRVVFCGCGHRSIGISKIVKVIPDFETIAVCDPYLDKAEDMAKFMEENTGVKPAVYGDHIKMFEELKPDAAIVATTWETHVRVSIDALNRGVAVAMEVGGAYNLDECYELIEAYERTKTPFMFLENCCFGQDELLVTSLVRNGVLGEISYCSGAYAHDVREEIAYGDIKRHYRLRNYIHRNAENYPTHELGPIAKLLNINRGNRMLSLVSYSSKARGLHEYVQKKPELAYLKDVEFKQGDVVQTMIKCENGELITIKLDTTMPRYYSRELVVRGTKGQYDMDNRAVYTDDDYCKDAADGMWEASHWFKSEERYYEKYMPEKWRHVTPEMIAQDHGGMDYFEFEVFADCLKNGKEMPIDVYDAVSWMSITFLSEMSLKQGGMPVEIPDFTKGAYKNRPPMDVFEMPKVDK